MGKQKILILFTALLAVYVTLRMSSATRAQQASANDEQIPSDLALDLDLANKNPAPNQKVIADVQTEKAQVTTNTGEKLDLPIKEAVPEEIKTQSSKDALNPDQTTSEQVVEKKEINSSEPNNQNNNKDNGDVQNNIPGTNILEPDDNTATPMPTSSSPSQNSSEGQNLPQSTPAGPDGNTNTTSEGSSAIPLENGVAPAPASPPDVGSSPKEAPAPAPAPEPPAPAPEAPAESPAVQGISTGPIVSWLKQFINELLR